LFPYFLKLNLLYLDSIGRSFVAGYFFFVQTSVVYPDKMSMSTESKRMDPFPRMEKKEQRERSTSRSYVVRTKTNWSTQLMLLNMFESPAPCMDNNLLPFFSFDS
jgi:hypothetical protein